ncbi:DNA methylase [Bullifex sp.]|uniref:Y-family DNA polymerase n=1 Tax=Bullifex sp. TaxID=2815808 RepID=UPI002A7F2AED|nr:DNA methylase [Bullifex sp.]MDY4067698.1 DNA methylase [Bullifex sp.]
MSTERTYIAIDLKSFYASAECVSRALDPLDANLVVADPSRSEKTICLAVSPSLKTYGIKGRARLFEVLQILKEANQKRARVCKLTGKSRSKKELDNNPNLAIDFHIAPPRMAYYIDISKSIYSIYLKYIAPEDIHVYSIDEVFIDATSYLKLYKMNAFDFTSMLINEVLKQTGITATAGIGTNLYLAKIAMDIEAKHIKADKNGVRIATLDEISYRKKLWDYKPLTDFWRFGKGIVDHLNRMGIHTMGELAKASLGSDEEYLNEDRLYKEFGVNAELLIDHAWGCESCRMEDIKAYKPENTSLTQGQVLQEPYSFDKAKIVLKEMADTISLDLVSKDLMADGIVLYVGYDIDNLKNGDYRGEIKLDHYGRKVPKSVNKAKKLNTYTSSSSQLINEFIKLYEEIVSPNLFIRRLNIAVTNLKCVKEAEEEIQLDLFSQKEDEEKLKKERALQKATLEIKERFGKNAILRALDYTDGATLKERNSQIGGHKA